MEKQLSKFAVKYFILATKVLPILIAICNLANTIISYFDSNDVFLNYIGSMSLLPILYLYFASYVFKLCEYYRMFLHYSIIATILNIYDYYIGVPISDFEYFAVGIILAVITMLIVIYLKFFK